MTRTRANADAQRRKSSRAQTLRSTIAKLKSERGDADPMLTIVSTAVVLIIAATLAGAIISMLQLGSNFIIEQVRTTILTSSQEAWAQDSANASWAVIDDSTSVAFYEIPGKHPSVYIPRADNAANQCRKSTWTVEDGTLRNVVEKYTDTMCDLNDSTNIPASTTTAVRLDGLTTGSTIIADNLAGRDLHYQGTTETGLTTGSTTPSVNTRASWWRDYEWEWPLPATINLQSTINLPLAGEREINLIGNTSIAPAAGGGTTAPETPPSPVIFDPGPITGLNVTRSTTTGAIYAGKHEGIDVSFNEVTCGPYTTEYNVKWEPATNGLTPSETTWTVSGTPGAAHIDKVPNGAAGTVTVTAACPASVSPAGPSTSGPQSYTQPVPDPGVTASVSSASTTNRHKIVWSAVTSLPVSYELFVSRAGGAFVSIATVPSTPNPSATYTWPAGSNFSVDYVYRVVSTVEGIDHVSADAPKLNTAWPVPATPRVYFSGNGRTNSNHTISVSSTSCVAGTSIEIDVWNSRTSTHRTLNGTGAFTEYAYLTAGSRYYSARAHCIVAGYTGPWSGTGRSNTINVTNPPPAIPAAPASCSGNGRWNAGGSGGGVVRGCFNSSSGATSYQYFGRYRVGVTWYSSSVLSRSSGGSLTVARCVTGPNMTAGGFAVRAGNSSGWSAYKFTYGTRDAGLWSCS